MINSLVIRDNRRHITTADYGELKPLLGGENIIFPKIKSLQAATLMRLFPAGITISHRSFDFARHSYRLGAYIDELREKGWPIVNHDEVALTKDIVPRNAKFTRYELYAEFTPELNERIAAFCKAVADFEAQAGRKVA